MSKSKATKKSKATRIHDLMKEMATSFKLKADAETDTTLRQTYLDVFNIAQEQRKLLLKEVVFDKKHPKSALFYDRLKKTPYRGTGSNKMFPPGTEVLKIQTFEETLDEDTSFR